jgi:hypothetical protein
MTRFAIHSRASAADLGVWPGATVAEAHDALCRDAGYTDAADCAARLGTTTAELRAELVFSRSHVCDDLEDELADLRETHAHEVAALHASIAELHEQVAYYRRAADQAAEQRDAVGARFLGLAHKEPR